MSAAARDLGLVANPAVLRQLSVVIESANPTEVSQFWQRVLDYAPADGGGLVDPLRRDPAIRFQQSTEPRPLRNRIHLDVVRPAAAVEQAGLGEARGPYGVCHTDPDGNEVDLLPGDALGEEIGTADWQAVFSAMACYRTTSPPTSRPLPANSGPPLMQDCRASFSCSSTPPTSPQSARSGSPHSDTPPTREPASPTSTTRDD